MAWGGGGFGGPPAGFGGGTAARAGLPFAGVPPELQSRVDQLLDDARKTNDEAARKAIFEKFQAVVEETVPGIIAYSAAHVNGVSRNSVMPVAMWIL